MGAGVRVWRWKDKAYSHLQSLDPEPAINEMKIAQLRSTVRSIWELPADWMNRQSADLRFDQNKMLGAEVGFRHGLVSPPSILSNDPLAVGNFIRASRAKMFAVKTPAMWAANVEGGETLATYTSRLSKSELLDRIGAVRHAPVIVQPYVSKAYELRVTVVGDHVFTCRIDSQGLSESAVDWRSAHVGEIPHTAFKLDADLEQRVKGFMCEAGLEYATFDFIVTPQEETFFVDCNPAGQYLWVESRTRLPITTAIADWLEGSAN
ncbi:hypothetical protein [Microbacterium candidum]|uniref:ATP-grasp domain-containing protein n=1 Tax=Microbacterium candidum TaxID=3041922 RepID=A0ABT7MW15_9MICO|nr:hypothetical protein [Microbacterium sp. ASV49]MDL9978632.1 hypothetical protein [Microbacterium sp. ASV49]